MPAEVTSKGAPTSISTSTKRFELPALEFKFGSLTDGTDIPPPLPSPKEEVPSPSPPKTPIPEIVEEKKQEENGSANGYGTYPKPGIAIPATVGIKRPAEDGPASPTLSNRGSLRRLLSRSLLNNAYNEQGSILSQDTSRPPSRTASTITDEKKSKRASGWFKRLRSNDNAKRVSQSFEEVKKPMGPPPPMIPELSALEAKVDTHLGDDLFKGIK